MSTFEALRDLIVEDYAVAPEQLQPETALSDLEIDSLGQLELVFSIEDRFGIKADDKAGPFETLQDVIDYIDELIARDRAQSNAL